MANAPSRRHLRGSDRPAHQPADHQPSTGERFLRTAIADEEASVLRSMAELAAAKP
jgi:hypothetical protein